MWNAASASGSARGSAGLLGISSDVGGKAGRQRLGASPADELLPTHAQMLPLPFACLSHWLKKIVFSSEENTSRFCAVSMRMK